MTTSAYRLDPGVSRGPTGGRLGSGDRFLAGLAALLLALAFAFPLWGVRFTAPDQPQAVELVAYPTHLAGGGSATIDELARVGELHRRAGLAPPRAGVHFWSAALSIGLAGAALCAVVAAWLGLRRWLATACQLVTAAAVLALAMAWGQLGALAQQRPVTTALVGVGQAGNLMAAAGPRAGAGLVALALLLALVALRKKP